MEAPLKSNEASPNFTSTMADQSEKFHCWVLFPRFDDEYGASFGGIFDYTNAEWASLEQTIRDYCKAKNRSPEIPIESIEDNCYKCDEGAVMLLRDKDGNDLVRIIKQTDPEGYVTNVLGRVHPPSLYQYRTIRYDRPKDEKLEFPDTTSKQWELVAPMITPGEMLFETGRNWSTYASLKQAGQHAVSESTPVNSDQKTFVLSDAKELVVIATAEGGFLWKVHVITEWSRDENSDKWIQSDIGGITSRRVAKRS